MTAAPPGQAALQPGEIVYLYHWRFDRGEEFGLYRHAEDAEAMAAERVGEGLSVVLSMAVLDRPQVAAAQEPHAAEVDAAFAGGMRVRTGPCTVEAHDREHFQVRTNGHWLCGHLLASVLAAQGIVASQEPHAADEVVCPGCRQSYDPAKGCIRTCRCIGPAETAPGLQAAPELVTFPGGPKIYGRITWSTATAAPASASQVRRHEAQAAREPHAAAGLREAVAAKLSIWRDYAADMAGGTRDEMTEGYAVGECAKELAAILDEYADAEPQPAPELAAERDGLRKALRAISLGIALPSPKTVADNALDGRYFDPEADSGVWRMSDLGTAWRLLDEARAEVATVIADRTENDRRLRLAIEQARGAGEETAAELDRVKGLLDDFTHAVIDLGSRPAVIEAAHAVRKTAGLPVVDQFSKLEEQR